jgi:precorrin-6B methylase 1
MPSGSLTVVGTGIDLGGHLTPQAKAAFTQAEEALYLVSDPATMSWLEKLNPRSRSLHTLYETGKARRETYEAMVEAILAPVREGRRVCAAFYGHPGVFVYPGNEAITRARSEGFEARMLPGISALDCLFADLGLDPARSGCQIHHATDFIANRIAPDTSAPLILLQISVIGELGYVEQPTWSHLPLLVEHLFAFYPHDHEVIGYEASSFPIIEPGVVRAPLSGLVGAELTPAMTLVVPAATEPTADPTMLDRLGLSQH